jgi:hypothetical protein
MDSSSYSHHNSPKCFALFGRPQLSKTKSLKYRRYLKETDQNYKFVVDVRDIKTKCRVAVSEEFFKLEPTEASPNSFLLLPETNLSAKELKVKTAATSLKLDVASEQNQNISSDSECSLAANIPGRNLSESVINKCAQIMNKANKDGSGAVEESEDISFDLTDFDSMQAAEICKMAAKSQTDSKRVQAYLERICGDRLAQMVESMILNLDSLITDKFGYFILRALILTSKRFVEACQKFCLDNFHQLAFNQYSVRVMRALAVSATFSQGVISIFRNDTHALAEHMQPVLILAAAIQNTKDDRLVEPIIRDLETKLSVTRNCQLLRILSSLVERAKGPSLERVSALILPHLSWLIDDKIGNFGVNMWLQKKKFDSSTTFQKIALDNPGSFMTKKYRKAIFLDYLTTQENNPQFIRHVLKKLLTNPNQTRQVFKKEDSAWLVLAALSKLDSNANKVELLKLKNKIDRVALETPLGQTEVNYQLITNFADRLIANDFESLEQLTSC